VAAGNGARIIKAPVLSPENDDLRFTSPASRSIWTLGSNAPTAVDGLINKYRRAA
jgi:hypothetical protein